MRTLGRQSVVVTLGKSPLAFCFFLMLGSQQAYACAAHLGFNPDDYGFVGGALIRMAGLAPQEPTFKIHHLPTTVVDIGEDAYFMIQYERPARAKDVKLSLSASKNIELIDKEFTLQEQSGTIQARFRLNDKGYNSIALTISGEHKSETVVQNSKIFVGAKPTLAKD